MLFQRMVVYAPTQGTVRIFTQALSRESGTWGITVNAVASGQIDTEANPAAGSAANAQLEAIALNLFGRDDEVSTLVAYLAATNRATARARHLRSTLGSTLRVLGTSDF